MEKDFDESINPEIIALSDIKNINYNSNNRFYDLLLKKRIQKDNPDLSNESIHTNITKEKNKKSNKLKLESKEKYYRINEAKSKELESKFKLVKLRINFDTKPGILRDGKFYTLTEGKFVIYNDKLYNKLYEIKLEENQEIISLIQLDNKDLIFLTKDNLIIYRLKIGKYSLLQKIEENIVGYDVQMTQIGNSFYSKEYCTSFINDISGNRFILASNYGFKIYSLNEKNEYDIILFETYYEGLKTIYELDKNTFIFCSDIDKSKIFVDKICLKEIKNNKKRKIIKELKRREMEFYEEYDFFDYENPVQNKKYKNIDEQSMFNSIKYTYKQTKILEYDKDCVHHYFNGYSILKNGILIINIGGTFFIYDIISCELLKRYEISINGINIYNGEANIIKWNNNSDNEFLFNLNGNIVLFELTYENNLKIIAQSYFKHIHNLKNLSKNSNKFYIEDKNTNLLNNIDGNNNFNRHNQSYCISIFY